MPLEKLQDSGGVFDCWRPNEDGSQDFKDVFDLLGTAEAQGAGAALLFGQHPELLDKVYVTFSLTVNVVLYFGTEGSAGTAAAESAAALEISGDRITVRYYPADKLRKADLNDPKQSASLFKELAEYLLNYHAELEEHCKQKLDELREFADYATEKCGQLDTDQLRNFCEKLSEDVKSLSTTLNIGLIATEMD